MGLQKILVTVFVLVAVSAFAQMPPKPGPELKKLDYFIGTWTTEATIPQGPWGEGGKFTGNDTTQWMPGNFFVEGRSDFKMPPEFGGDGHEVSYMGYDTDENVYTFSGFSSQGRRELSKGTVSGDTWTWTSTGNYGGQEFKQKMTVKILSPSSYSMKLETSMDGTNWMTFMEGKATKK